MTGVAALTGSTLFLLIVAPIVAWPSTRLLLGRYRRAVVRMMRRSGTVPGGASDGVPFGPSAAHARLGRSSPPRALGQVDRGNVGLTSADALAARSISGRRRLLQRYALAGAAFSVVLTLATLMAESIPVTPVRLLAVSVLYMWPLTVTAAVIAGFEWPWWVSVTLAYVGVLVVTAIIGHVPRELVLAWALLNLPATVLLLPFLHPSVRAVGVVVLAFVLTGLTGALSFTSFIGADVERLAWVTDLLVPLGISGVVAFWLLLLTGFVVAAAVGWVALRGIAYSYRRRGLPDQLLLVGGVWAFFAADYAVPLAFEGIVWPVAGVAAFAVFWLIAGRRGASVHLPRGPRLLMLRVFALGVRSERMFRRIAANWEHIGPIRLVGGPDLARATVEPDEFLTFVSGGLERLFITDPSQVEQRLRAEPDGRDRLGRFRVQEFLCFDDTWRPTVRTLLDATDLVLMDARGFGPGNDGARHELTELARHRMLHRTALLVDATTDRELMAAAVTYGGGRSADLRIVDVTGRRPPFARLLRAFTAEHAANIQA